MTEELNGQRVFFLDEGPREGEAVVLLHGWGTDHSLFRPLTDLLVRKYRVIAPDFPGFGQSPEPAFPWTLDDYADHVLALLERLGIARCILLGHSFGGRLTIKLAARGLAAPVFPKLILVDAAGIKPAPTKRSRRRARRYRIGKKLLRPFPKLMEAYRNRHGSADYRAASPMMRQVLVKTVNEDLTPLLEKVQPPTLLIWGRNDTATPLKDGQLMQEKIPGAGLVILEDAGHYAFLEKQAQFLRVIGSFLEIRP
ncbi:MAG: alpha/beta hydrolase [Oscillospiraceae bacterium]|jgi:pimeloyl-ACP methyl ester carboxylesterase|nr:alpha/beta hydrolase [Oscillospiraceae bacterium]